MLQRPPRNKVRSRRYEIVMQLRCPPMKQVLPMALDTCIAFPQVCRLMHAEGTIATALPNLIHSVLRD